MHWSPSSGYLCTCRALHTALCKGASYRILLHGTSCRLRTGWSELDSWWLSLFPGHQRLYSNPKLICSLRWPWRSGSPAWESCTQLDLSGHLVLRFVRASHIASHPTLLGISCKLRTILIYVRSPSLSIVPLGHSCCSTKSKYKIIFTSFLHPMQEWSENVAWNVLWVNPWA